MAKYIGTRKYVTGTEMREAYDELAAKNEKAALLLEKNGLYQESVYMYIQTMEKKVNPPRPNASIMDEASCRMRERKQVSPYSFPHCHFRWHRLSNYR